MKGFDVITALKELISENVIIVSSNGNISREVFNLLPQPQVYLRGSMGLPVPIGLGLALANPDKQILVITGDGNFLMGFNSSVTTAFYKPKNLKILILDNNKYFTTGGQETVSSALDYGSFLNSLNIGYSESKQAKKEKVKNNLIEFLKSKSFSILHLQIDSGKLQLENIPYRVMSVKHLQQLQDKIDKLHKEKKISQHETLQHYIGKFKFAVPKDFPEAKSVIVLAVECNLAKIPFHYKGKKYDVLLPGNYSATSKTPKEEIDDFVLEKIIGQSDYRVQQTRQLHLKFLTTSSGLGRYGRNNISYVDELGSFIELYAIFTDYEFDEDHYVEAKMMDRCEKCTICIDRCPNQCISQDNFIIDVERCIPLYNEISGEFPEWLVTDSHMAIMGCLHCQML